MMRFLANENLAVEVVLAARREGYDVAWMVERQPGASDDDVLKLALEESRVLLTFDKDFGELAFHRGRKATCGVILFRPRVRSAAYVVDFVLAVLRNPVDWQGCFSVAHEGRLRVVPLPESS